MRALLALLTVSILPAVGVDISGTWKLDGNMNFIEGPNLRNFIGTISETPCDIPARMEKCGSPSRKALPMDRRELRIPQCLEVKKGGKFASDRAVPRPERADAPGLPEGPTIFTALRERLGLRLESDKGPLEFW